MMDGTNQAVWLVEVNERTILYKAVGDRKGPTLQVPTQTVKLITFASGGTHSVQPWGESLPSKPGLQIPYKQAFYYDMGSLGFGYLAGSFQFRARPRVVWEIGAGYIGIGQDPNQPRPIDQTQEVEVEIDGNPVMISSQYRRKYEPYTGAFIRGGPRLYLRSKQVWQGFYLYPQLLASQMERSAAFTNLNNSPLAEDHQNDYDYIDQTKHTYIGGALNLGYQHLFFQRLSLDIYTGLGYTYLTFDRTRIDLLTHQESHTPFIQWDDYNHTYQYLHFNQKRWRVGRNSIVTLVVQMGWLF